MERARTKFATQVEPELLAEIRRIARAEGRQVQVIVEEAFRTYLEARRASMPRPEVMGHYQASHTRYASLYRRLAK